MFSLTRKRITKQIYLTGHKALRQFTPDCIFINGPFLYNPLPLRNLELGAFILSPAQRSCSVLFAVSEIAECFHLKSMVWFQDLPSI